MATIVPTLMTGSGQRTLAATGMTTSDTFVYRPGTGQILILRNATGGTLTPVIDGDGGTTVPVQGIGNVSVDGGYSVGAVATGVIKAIPLDTISAYLQGVITVTGCNGMAANLLNPS